MKRPNITLNENHQYIVEGVRIGKTTGLPKPLSSCSTIAKHIDTYAGGLMDWAAKLALQSGEVDDHKRASQESIDIGLEFHDEVNKYIQSGVTPKNPSKLFGVWFSYMREEFGVDLDKFVASEYMLYHPSLEYGGTVDAIAESDGKITIFDWKTREELRDDGSVKSFVPLTDAVQVGGYHRAIMSQPLEWYEEVVGKGVGYPEKGYIVIIYRDTLRAEKKEVNLSRAGLAFQHCLEVHESKGGLYVRPKK